MKKLDTRSPYLMSTSLETFRQLSCIHMHLFLVIKNVVYTTSINLAQLPLGHSMLAAPWFLADCEVHESLFVPWEEATPIALHHVVKDADVNHPTMAFRHMVIEIIGHHSLDGLAAIEPAQLATPASAAFPLLPVLHQIEHVVVVGLVWAKHHPAALNKPK